VPTGWPQRVALPLTIDNPHHPQLNASNAFGQHLEGSVNRSIGSRHGTRTARLTLYWTHKGIALLKKLGLGICHGFRRRYIRRYLDEFVWPFNRRHYRPATFHLNLGLATKDATSSAVEDHR
jgi:hypothetical protein